jgi:hypothetical protein
VLPTDDQLVSTVNWLYATYVYVYARCLSLHACCRASLLSLQRIVAAAAVLGVCFAR